jgi:acetyl esterase
MRDTMPAALTSEMQAEWSALKARLAKLPDPMGLSLSEARQIDQQVHAYWNVNLPVMDEVRRFTIPGDQQLLAHDCDAVAYRPKRAGRGKILFVHGGGWCFCNLETHERFMRALADTSRKEVIGVHYRLAPEHPFPAGLMDVISAYRSIFRNPERFGVSNGPLVIGGDSAGVNLALATMLHEVREARPLPAGALLLYGAFGVDLSMPSYQLYGEGYWVTEGEMRQCLNWYLPAPEMWSNPLAAPLLAPDELLRALPPLFLMGAEVDVLASDTLALKSRLDRLGRSDAFHIEPGVMHGFLQMTSILEAAGKVTQLAANAANSFIDRAAV